LVVTHKVLILHKTEDQEQVQAELETLEDTLLLKETQRPVAAAEEQVDPDRELQADPELQQILQVHV
jgi:hypothetical protein